MKTHTVFTLIFSVALAAPRDPIHSYRRGYEGSSVLGLGYGGLGRFMGFGLLPRFSHGYDGLMGYGSLLRYGVGYGTDGSLRYGPRIASGYGSVGAIQYDPLTAIGIRYGAGGSMSHGPIPGYNFGYWGGGRLPVDGSGYRELYSRHTGYGPLSIYGQIGPSTHYRKKKY